MNKQQICILGSTGSIGTQALDVISQHQDRYEVYALTANNRVELLAQQVHQFNPAAVVIANEARYDELKALLSDRPDIKVYVQRYELIPEKASSLIDSLLLGRITIDGTNALTVVAVV